jgi:glycosyltransferase involved in cell wall biosynthesis
VKIAVVVPAFNQARLLPATIESILSQSYPAAEVVVVDDGSTDDTAAAIRKFQPAVRFIKTEKNLGICGARNTGIAATDSDWVALCDHDDLWHPSKLYWQARLVELAPRAEFQFTDFVHIINDKWQPERKFFGIDDAYWAEGRQVVEPDLWLFSGGMFLRLLTYQPVFPSTMLLSRSLLRRVGGFVEALGKEPAEDQEFTLRCQPQSQVGAVAKALVGIRKHSGNYSRDPAANIVSETKILRFVLDRHRGIGEYRAELIHGIQQRSVAAAEWVFLRGDFDSVKELLKDVPRGSQTTKVRLKSAIAGMPRPIAKALQKALISLARLRPRPAK